MKKRSETKKIVSWAVYDFANTAFSALFVTFFYPLYIKEFLNGNEFQLGLVMGISMFLVGIFVPFLGALSDILGKRMPYLFAFTIICVTATSLVAFSDLTFALFLGLIANFAYHASLTVYNAILPDISTEKNRGHISGYSVGLGYLGTLVSLGMAFLILNRMGWETIEGVRMMFIATAFFFLLFSTITFYYVKDKKRKPVKDHPVKRALSEIKKTITHIKKYPNLFLFLAASFLYTNGINTVIVFIFLYGREQIGLSTANFTWMYALFALAAALGAYFFGMLADLIGSKKSITIAILVWIFVAVMLIKMSTTQTYIIAGLLGGAAMGAVVAVNRPMLISLSPIKKIGEFFGFLELTGKFSGFIGPIVFGFLAARYNYPVAVYSLLFFFSAGLILLQFVKKKEKD